ncbi:MAG: MerR family transcriptional regulator [Candidatus Eremiobacteraeota bacterium]|nr:MerR family transcriptional regulator [Candidatus Eremiobacteraeota bacterium]
MEAQGSKLLQAGEFAEMAGVTVRALHHYDELGLLTPTAHSEAGYRLYAAADLVRLEHITALRFIGLALKEIRDVLGGGSQSLASALQMQHDAMLQKRKHLDAAIEAVRHAQATLSSEKSEQWKALRTIMETMNMQQDYEWVKAHYTPEQLERLAERYDPAMQEQWSNQWATVIAAVEAAKDDDPGSPQAQALAEQWHGLISQFTRGEPDIEQSLKNVYADKSAQPRGFSPPFSDQAGAFIKKAMAIRAKG